MKSVDDVVVGAITARGNDEVRPLLTRISCQLYQVPAALAFADIQVNVPFAENYERALEQAARLALLRGRVEQDDDSHGLGWEGFGGNLNLTRLCLRPTLKTMSR